MALTDYQDFDALGLAELVRRGAVSPAELVEAAIERIERHNPALNAVTLKAFDQARTTAAGPVPAGPFAGVPFLIKDIDLEVAGWPMSNGSAYLKGYVSRTDSELTRRYRSAGLVFMGKTNTPEFGIPATTEGRHLGICRNPWNPGFSTGGSSGGAAAAVASGMVPVAHASDGLGSIRTPASQCGLVGLKPTQNRNPGGPDDGGRAHGLVVDHVLTRTVRDCAAMLDWTGRPEDDSPYAGPPKAGPFLDELASPPGRLRIAFSIDTPRKLTPHPDVQAVFETTAKQLEALGHTLIDTPDLGIDWRRMYRAQSAVGAGMFVAAIQDWARVLGREPKEEDLEPLAWDSYRRGQAVTGAEVAAGLRDMRRAAREVLRLWRGFDVLLTPVALAPAPPIGHLDPVAVEPREYNRRQGQLFLYPPPANITGQPSLSLPLGMSRDGLPIGMLFTGRFGDEATLFRLAAQIEAAHPWIARRPPIWG
jgi:amidase